MIVSDLVNKLKILVANDPRILDYGVDIPTTAYGSIDNDPVTSIDVDHEERTLTLS